MGVSCSECLRDADDYHHQDTDPPQIPESMGREELYQDNYLLSRRILLYRIKLGEITLAEVGAKVLGVPH